ncbi:PTS sugar transporter subunit IIA [Halanaerocella petrolearia]
MIVDSDLVKINPQVQTKEEVICSLSNLLLKKGIIKESFYEAVIKREEEFPTGLQGKYINFAIPHTESRHVNESAIAVATLENGVKFNGMEDSKKEYEVEVIFLLSVKDRSKQTTILQNLLQLMQDEEKIKLLLTAKDDTEIVNLLENNVVKSLEVKK